MVDNVLHVCDRIVCDAWNIKWNQHGWPWTNDKKKVHPSKTSRSQWCVCGDGSHSAPSYSYFRHRRADTCASHTKMLLFWRRHPRFLRSFFFSPAFVVVGPSVYQLGLKGFLVFALPVMPVTDSGRWKSVILFITFLFRGSRAVRSVQHVLEAGGIGFFCQ